MSGTLDRTAALRLGARLLRRRSYQLQASGQFTDAESHHEAAAALDGLRFALDPGIRELEGTGGTERGGMATSLADEYGEAER